jgi:hypothetical protein
MFPKIKKSSNSIDDLRFVIKGESIDDLFFDNKMEPISETRKVQDVFDRYKSEMNQLYFSTERTKKTDDSIEKTKTMNRENFCLLAYRTVGIPPQNANEIFSCATELFGGDDEYSLPDTFMTTTQFSTGVVRLANLAAMISDGMENSSMLAKQTELFLSQAIK